MRERNALAQQPFDLGFGCTWMLTADAFTRYLAREFMQAQSKCDSLFACHAAVMLNLNFQPLVGSHAKILSQFVDSYAKTATDACHRAHGRAAS
ncbi:MAG TPA: hypothetical protein VFD27_08060 [Chthoniobacteraceae bacterium]|nr:hypothetical protein [Chthoniobacteraceae bacterium]